MGKLSLFASRGSFTIGIIRIVIFYAAIINVF